MPTPLLTLNRKRRRRWFEINSFTANRRQRGKRRAIARDPERLSIKKAEAARFRRNSILKLLRELCVLEREVFPGAYAPRLA